MSFVTNRIQVDGSLNVDGSIYQFNELFTPGGGGTGDVAWANGNDGANNQLITAAGDGSIVAESSIYFDSNTLYGADGAPTDLTIRAGDTNLGGTLTLRGGDDISIPVYGAKITLSPGDGVNTGNGGHLKLEGGDSALANQGGAVSIDGGPGTAGTASDGSISIGTEHASAIYIGRTNSEIDIANSEVIINTTDISTGSSLGLSAESGILLQSTSNPISDIAYWYYDNLNDTGLFYRKGSSSSLMRQTYRGFEFFAGFSSTPSLILDIRIPSTGGTPDLSIGGTIHVSGLSSGTESNAVYYNTTTKELKYGAAPSGGGGDVAWASGSVGINNQIITANGDGSIVAETGLRFSSGTLSAPSFTNLTIEAGGTYPSLGGTLTLKGGDEDDTGSDFGGSIRLYPSPVGGGGGGVIIQSGDADNGPVQDVSILGGDGLDVGDNGGNIYIAGGEGDDIGGSVTIIGGVGDSDDGIINLGTTNTAEIRSSTGAIGTGTPIASEVLFMDTGTNSAFRRVSGALPVAVGGTGQTTFNSNSVLTGNGTGGIVAETGMVYNSALILGGTAKSASAQTGTLIQLTGADPYITFNQPTSDRGGLQWLDSANATGENARFTWYSFANQNQFDWYIKASSGASEINAMRLTGNGTTPDYSLHVEDDVVAYSTVISDRRLKTDINSIGNTLDDILKLQGISYKRIGKESRGTHYGYIAQDFEEIFPGLIKETELINGDSDERYKTIRYTELIPFITEAMKEQKQIIDSQEKRINDLEKKLSEILEKLS